MSVRTGIPAGPQRAMLGCWALHDRHGALLDSTYYNASGRVRLDSVEWPHNTASDRVPGAARRLTPLVPGAARGTRRDDQLCWQADARGDSVRLSFSTGFSGAALILSAPPGTDTLHGRIVEFWDFGPPQVTHRGRGFAVRISC
jgi:hypothetical protein